ncbi:MAG TPA: zincin-like metallopeptidase domain-containing protein [Stellaceae bacterium]|nr:zincin-like metallopeptidase domain-containing protein [Stellaceae bacterium]
MSTRSAHHKNAHTAHDLYTEVTDRVIAALEAGTPPWRKPWSSPGNASNASNASPEMPCNAVTGARYRGINVLALTMSALAFATCDPRWATYKQSADQGWQVRKGERGTTAYFFKQLEVAGTRDDAKQDPAAATRRVPLLRAFTLFHASQIDGIPPFTALTGVEAPWRAPDAAETIVANSCITIQIGGDRAYYAPASDHIQMPPPNAFRSADAWSSTILHEASHASSHPSRLNRDLHNAAFGSPDYAREELRAEVAQLMICAELGIADCEFTNGAAYVKSWLEVLRSDRKEIFRAAAEAQRIADYLLAFHPDYAAGQQITTAAAVDAAGPSSPV